jgi:hypothetical protein
VFFDALGIKWWYEPEGYSLRFDYKYSPANWMMTREERLQAGIPQTFQPLDGKEYWYLPDFYLPELNYWIEIKGPNPTREEVEKAFMLSHMVLSASIQQSYKAFFEAFQEARAEGKSEEEAMDSAESSTAEEDVFRHGVYIIYGDVPWPFPQNGNIFGYGSHLDSGSTFFDRLAKAEPVAGESGRKETEYYRHLLGGKLKLCWQECPLCLKIGIGKIGAPYCRSCHDQIAMHIWDHLPRYQVMRGAGTQDTSDQVMRDAEEAVFAGVKPPNTANAKALELTQGLMNPEFFTSGHKSPRLREAYNTARSARFEHGQSP